MKHQKIDENMFIFHSMNATFNKIFLQTAWIEILKLAANN